MLNPSPIIAPVIALAVWTHVMWAWMYATRIPAVRAREIDLECGSTTANFERKKEVAFSPIFFIAGTKLLVPRRSGITSYRDLRDKTVVVTAGTTNEAAVQAISDKQHLGIKLVIGKDHAEYQAIVNTITMHPDDMKEVGIAPGDSVRVWSENGEATFQCREGKVPLGMIFVPYGPPTCRLMGQTTDGTGMPTSKGWEVEVEPITQN